MGLGVGVIAVKINVATHSHTISKNPQSIMYKMCKHYPRLTCYPFIFLNETVGLHIYKLLYSVQNRINLSTEQRFGADLTI